MLERQSDASIRSISHLPRRPLPTLVDRARPGGRLCSFADRSPRYPRSTGHAGRSRRAEVDEPNRGQRRRPAQDGCDGAAGRRLATSARGGDPLGERSIPSATTSHRRASTRGDRDRSPSPAISSARDPDEAALDAVAATGEPLALPEAIHLAFRYQPRLRAQLESIAQARGQQQIAFSTFLPTVASNYDVGGFTLGVGGEPVRFGKGTTSGFNFIPLIGAVPVGLHIKTGYELAELKVQWLLLDFGRRLGHFEQAKLAVDVAQLQTDRAFQTVANEVAVAYYGVLRAQALRRTAQDAVRRAEEELEDARKLQREGVIERETVLRSEVLRAELRNNSTPPRRESSWRWRNWTWPSA